MNPLLSAQVFIYKSNPIFLYDEARSYTTLHRLILYLLIRRKTDGRRDPTCSVPGYIHANPFHSEAAEHWKAVEAEQEEERQERQKWKERRAVLDFLFRNTFAELLDNPGHLELSAEYPSWERAVAHHVAGELGLKHESVGDEGGKRLVVSSELPRQ